MKKLFFFWKNCITAALTHPWIFPLKEIANKEVDRKWRQNRIPGHFFVLIHRLTKMAASSSIPRPILMRFFSLCTVTSCLQTQLIDRRNMCTIHTHARFFDFFLFPILFHCASQRHSLPYKVDDVVFVSASLDYKGAIQLILDTKHFGPWHRSSEITATAIKVKSKNGWHWIS